MHRPAAKYRGLPSTARGVQSTHVAQPPPSDSSELSGRPPGDRLDSWKEIAGYLRRDVTTVQRWERREGMPVHRHLHDKQGSVYAFRRDLDVWARGRIGRLAVSDLPPEPAPDEPAERPNDAAVVARPGAPRPRLGPWILGADRDIGGDRRHGLATSTRPLVKST